MTDLTQSFPATPGIFQRLKHLGTDMIAGFRSQRAGREFRISGRISDYEPGRHGNADRHDWAREARNYKDRHMTWL